MPTVVLARVDDRLIHGQVVIKWLRAVPCREIVICDDQVSADPFLRRVLTLAKPPSIQLRILSIAEAVGYLGAGDGAPAEPSGAAPLAAEDLTVMLLVKSPATVRALLDSGVHLDSLNVGGMAPSPGSRRIYKSVSATPEQLEILQGIRELGVQVLFQTVPEPEEPAVPLDSLRL